MALAKQMALTIQACIMVIAVSLFLVSCTSFGTGRTGPRPIADFRVGSDGARIQFMPNLPPPRLYDDQPFDVLIRVWNVGAENVGGSNDRIYLSGFDPSIITGLSAFGQPIPKLEGKTQYNLEGTFDYVSFKGTIRNLKSLNVDRYPVSPLLATACYQYKTVSSENVCIDPDPFSTSAKTKACVSRPASAGTQGAPIAVQRIDVEPSTSRSRFQIDIANVGGGDVFLPGAVYSTKCSPFDPRGLEFSEVDRVRLDRMEVAGTSITPSCRPVDSQGFIRLINGRATIVCEYVSSGQGSAFVTPLITELRYGYRRTASTSVDILPSR